jgi:hypothetical protein
LLKGEKGGGKTSGLYLGECLFSGEGEDRGGEGGDGDRHVEPVQEGALVREEQLGLHLQAQGQRRRRGQGLCGTEAGVGKMVWEGREVWWCTFWMAMRLWNSASADQPHNFEQQLPTTHSTDTA